MKAVNICVNIVLYCGKRLNLLKNKKMLQKIFEFKIDELTCSGENHNKKSYFELFTVFFLNMYIM